MMRGRAILMLSLIAAWPAIASETTTYTYDALGRLVQVSNAGGPRNGATNATRYDPAGNRGASSMSEMGRKRTLGAHE